jgi:hypothetical protein
MQIKKTELAKIIREEIQNTINEAFRMAPRVKPIEDFKKRRDNTVLNVYNRPMMGEKPENVAKMFDKALEMFIKAGGIEEKDADGQDTEALMDVQDELLRVMRNTEGLSPAHKAQVMMSIVGLYNKTVEELKAVQKTAKEEMAKAAEAGKKMRQDRLAKRKPVDIRDRMGKLDEDEIQAARFKHAHLPGNDKEGQFGKVQPLEEVGMISTFMDPAIFAGLSPAAQALLGILDPILTVSGVGAVTTALMTYFRGPNKEMPTVARIPDAEAQTLMRAFREVEREIGADKVDQPRERKAALDTLRKELGSTPKRVEEPEVDAGIPADELGAKR